MKVYQTNEIRNVALIGSARSGKSTLAESMLFEGKVISRRGTIEDKNTTSDYRDIEIARQNSVVGTVMYSEFNDHKINIVDTPGFTDFIGEVHWACNIASTALMVVNSHSGVEVGTEVSFRVVEKTGIPTVFVINQLEHEKANFDDTLNQIKHFFGDKAIPVQYPVNAGPDFDAVIDLILMKMLKFPKGGGAYEELDIPANEMDKAAEKQMELIEIAATGDEGLMEIYFENDTLTPDELRRGIKLGLRTQSIFPVMCVSGLENMGIGRLMDFIIASTPAPNKGRVRTNEEGKELRCNVEDPTSLLVFKSTIEAHLGEVAYFKVYGGTLKEGDDLHNTRNTTKERISQLFIMAGKNRTKVDQVVAGDIAATIKLKNTHANDTLASSHDSSFTIRPIEFPEPIFFTAIKAKNSSDDEKFGAALQEISRNDSALNVQYSRELKQNIMSGQGELHINIAKWYLDNQFHIETEFATPRIQYRETITKPAKADYRHKKQSGGSGQFGEVHLMIQPYTENMPKPTDFPVRGTEEHEMSWGGKLIFNNCIVGGSIDARFMPAILKGVMERMENGPLTGSYARDISVYIYDGKMHPVDSNEISFKLAGRHAFSTAFKNASPKIMEPIMDVEVFTPEEKMGDTMTDLQGRRAIIMGMESKGRYQLLKARVPLAEMNRYSTSLSSISSGRATYSMNFADYSQVPSDVQTALLKKYEEEQASEDDN